MNKICFFLFIFLILAISLESVYIFYPQSFSFLFPIRKEQSSPKPLLVYTFENLKKIIFPVSTISLGKVLTEHADYVSRVFFYQTLVRPGEKAQEKVSGLINIPKKKGKHPIIVMFRGFVPSNMYQPGVGTQPVASVLAENGYITLAPDFLGFGESASPSADAFENRFQTYTTAISLLSSLSTLPVALSVNYGATISADMTKVGIWAHSNGGHIALAVLAITGVTYPTVLWAPVSTSFPYDLLYYTDEADDQGKVLRRMLGDFEKTYNTDLFSPPNYYTWIRSPIELDQGTADQEVPIWWSDGLAATLRKDKVDVTYNTYNGADHNLLPNAWSRAVVNDLDFYTKQFTK